MRRESGTDGWAGVFLGLAGVTGAAWLTGRVVGFRGLPFALTAHVLLMRWALYVLRAVPVRPPERWYRVRPWEPGLYRRLGVLGYRRLLRRVGWERFRRGATGFDGRRASLPAYERATREAEFSHLLLAGLGTGLVAGAVARRAWNAAGWLLGANLFFQVYPVMLQRTMRARLERLRPPRRAAAGH
ncbi:hypothetical protein [Deinococcus planocerae]|uniref:glycosyl-4,4'-diaponeurosporenoate acyltransferase CrtO family protein n=1 Tax=Deinococcus planocerae TaxID=1737569 RepID=UPI000C7EE443|nr:hypothetical protein [Deinococcus planocerae]